MEYGKVMGFPKGGFPYWTLYTECSLQDWGNDHRRTGSDYFFPLVNNKMY